jgi:hypothetical protein
MVAVEDEISFRQNGVSRVAVVLVEIVWGVVQQYNATGQ